MIFCSCFWLLCHVHWGGVLLSHTQEVRNYQYGKFACAREQWNCIFWESPEKEHNFCPWWLTGKFIAGADTVFIHSRLTHIRISTVSLLLLYVNSARLLERSMLSFKSTRHFFYCLEAFKNLHEVLLCCKPGSECPVVFGPFLSDKSIWAGTWHYLLDFVVWCHSSKESDRMVNKHRDSQCETGRGSRQMPRHLLPSLFDNLHCSLMNIHQFTILNVPGTGYLFLKTQGSAGYGLRKG